MWRVKGGGREKGGWQLVFTIEQLFVYPRLYLLDFFKLINWGGFDFGAAATGLHWPFLS